MIGRVGAASLTAPGNTMNDYVQIIGARVTVDAGDNSGLMGLSLEDGATLSDHSLLRCRLTFQ